MIARNPSHSALGLIDSSAAELARSCLRFCVPTLARHWHQALVCAPQREELRGSGHLDHVPPCGASLERPARLYLRKRVRSGTKAAR